MTVSTPFRVAIDLIRSDSAAFDEKVHARYLGLVKKPLPLIPYSHAVCALLEGCTDATGSLGPAAATLADTIGRYAIEQGFENFSLLAECIHEQLRRFVGPLRFMEIIIIEQVISNAATRMTQLRVDPTISRPIPATVVEVERRSSSITVVRLIAEEPVIYQPGQHLSVTNDFLNGQWRDLVPTAPQNPERQIEFHVTRDSHGFASPRLVSARPGDIWHLTNGRGGFPIMGYDDPPAFQPDLLLICHGTGLAAMRAVIIDLIMKPNPPAVHLFVSADYPGEHYDLIGLWHLASAAPWLFITPINVNDQDAWWVTPSEHSRAPRGLHLTQIGQAGDIVSSYGAWGDRKVLISGPQYFVDNTYNRLVMGGTPMGNINAVGFNHRYVWDLDPWSL